MQRNRNSQNQSNPFNQNPDRNSSRPQRMNSSGDQYGNYPSTERFSANDRQQNWQGRSNSESNYGGEHLNWDNGTSSNSPSGVGMGRYDHTYNDNSHTAYGARGSSMSSLGSNASGMYSEMGSSRSGTLSHSGKGPKNYRRSDERIHEDVSEALTQDHDIDASEIEVSVAEGIVTLSGTVTERRMKRAAEDCAEKVTGVKDIKNNITIASVSGESSLAGDRSPSKARTQNLQ